MEGSKKLYGWNGMEELTMYEEAKTHDFLAEGPPGSEDEDECQICGFPKVMHRNFMEVVDPRGDGAVRDDQGQSNIIDYTNQEPLLFGAGENSSHDYPGKIVVNNEPERVLPVNDFQKYGTTNDSGSHGVGADTTEPTLPTGAPQDMYEIDHNAHGLNFNNTIQWNEAKGFFEVVSVPSSAVEKDIGTDCNSCKRKSNEEYLLENDEAMAMPGPHDKYADDYSEANFKEEDHPRAPAGTMHGGEFIKRDGPPMGNSKEDKAARKEFWQPTESDNQKITELSDDITLKTIDANMAKMDGKFTEEQELREEVASLKSQQNTLVKQLKDADKLEGVQAQRTLHAIDKLDAAIAAAKPGTKKQENLRIEKMGHEFRLDRIRKGVHADYDLDGNPVNEAAFQEQQEKKRVKAAMEKKPIKTKQKDLQDFEGNVTMKLGKSVDKRHVEQIKKIWNNLDASDRALVKSLTIRSTRQRGNFTAGEWKGNGQMELTTHPLSTEKDYEEAIHHEIGHAKFRTYPKEKVDAWNAAVKEIQPVSKYANYHKERYEKYRMNNLRVRESDVEIVKNNIKALENLYYEEMHSEVLANMKSPLPQKKLWFGDGMEKATKLYKEIFN